MLSETKQGQKQNKISVSRNTNNRQDKE